MLGDLLPSLEDGVLFDFSGGIFSRDFVRIPLWQLADRFVPDQAADLESATQIGALVLDRKADAWRLALKSSVTRDGLRYNSHANAWPAVWGQRVNV